MYKISTLFLTICSCLMSVAQVNDTCFIAKYDMNGSPADSSGNGFHGDSFGSTLTSDKSGSANSAYLFDGVDDYISLNGSNPVINTNTFSITCWARMDGIGGGTFNKNVLFNQRDESNPGASSIVTIMAENGSNNIAFALKGSASSSTQAITYPSLPYNEWHHYACILDNNDSMKIYLDGILVASTIYTGSHNFIAGNDDTDIGRQRYGGQEAAFFNGAIDQFYIFDCALSQNEIKTLAEDSALASNFNTTLFQKGELSIYPNPVSKGILIAQLSSGIILNSNLMTIEGRVVISEFNGNSNKVLINTDYLARGNYLLKVISSEGIHIQKVSISE